MIIQKLPSGLENGKAILARRQAAKGRKEMWRDTYRDAYDYCMPQRETFNWHAPGQKKDRHIFDSTGQSATYFAANTMQAMLCPPWRQWGTFAPSALLPNEVRESQEIVDQLQDQAEILFHYLHISNFDLAIHECFLDLQVGTCALQLDEGDDESPLVFDAIPLSVIELEEGPRGTVETKYLERKVQVMHLTRIYTGLNEADLPAKWRKLLQDKPETQVCVVQCCIYDAKTASYYGVALSEDGDIFWRYNYGDTSPVIVARAMVTPGEIYGRGPALMALNDIKTLNVMTEYVLRHSALQVAPPIMAVADSVVNPYTLSLTPNTIIPVQSGESLVPLVTGANFQVTDVLMGQLRERIMQVMLSQFQTADGPVKSATEISINDRNELWQKGSVFSRIQTELFPKIIKRAVAILSSRGLMQPIKVGGMSVAVKYISPLARSQDAEDLLALQRSLELALPIMGEEGVQLGFKIEKLPAWLSKRTGMDADLVRSEDEAKQVGETAMDNEMAAGAVENAQPTG